MSVETVEGARWPFRQSNMRAIRWVEWPKRILRPEAHFGPTYVETIQLAHAFVTSDGRIDQALCGATPLGVVRIVHPAVEHRKCAACDEALRAMGGPHPPAVNERSTSTVYLPRHTIEEWEES